LPTNSSGATMHRILGYLAKEDRVYLVDKGLNIVSYKIMLAVLQYQTAVMRGDFDAANELLPSIPESEYTTVARFLESQGFKEEAMAVTLDPDHKFDLALELNLIDEAHNLILETPQDDANTTDTVTKWKRLSDAALKQNNFALTEAASIASDDFSGLLLLYSATGNLKGVQELADLATQSGKINVAFVANLLVGNVEQCSDLLIQSKRLPEAAFFARTFIPSRVQQIVSLWKEDLAKVSESAAKALASPNLNPDLFPDFQVALQVEQMFLAQRQATQNGHIPAQDYLTAKEDLDLDLIKLVKTRTQQLAGVDPVEQEQKEEERLMAEEEERLRIEAEALQAKEAQAQAEALLAKELAEKKRLEEEAALPAKSDIDDFGDDW